MIKIALFLGFFVAGELIFNLIWFRYLKSYFAMETTQQTDSQKKTSASGKILFMELSVFKGIMERVMLTYGLILGFAPTLIVFGTIKLGTRFKDDQEIKNDYFLIGNFSTILISMVYYSLNKLL